MTILEPIQNKTSHSEVESFLTCERRHYYSYGLKLDSMKMSQALYRGIVGHEILATYYRARKEGIPHTSAVAEAFAQLIVADRTNTTHEQDICRLELAGLLTKYFKEYADCDWEILEVEKEIKTTLPDNTVMTFIIDLIVRIPGEGVAAIDHKFTYDFYNPDIVDLSPQLPKYLAGLLQEGYVVHKAMYNEIRYRVTADNRKNPEALFRRTHVEISRERIHNTMREQILTARRTSKYKQMSLEEWEKRVLRTANGMVCKMCPFTQICVSDLNGQPTDILMGTFYKPKQRREDRNI